MLTNGSSESVLPSLELLIHGGPDAKILTDLAPKFVLQFVSC